MAIQKVLRSTAVLLVAAFTLSGANADTHTLCEGFLPENDMNIPVGMKMAAGGGITEAEFNAVLDRAQRLFAPWVAQKGGTLQIKRLWSDGTVNASAQQIGKTWVLNMYGGLARHPATNIEGFALVVCHELGHHLGGAPKIKSWFGGNDWATNEGGSDYYAGLKCLRYFFDEDDNAAIIAKNTIDPFAAKICDQEFSKEADRNICKRTTLSGASVAGLFQALRKETTPPDYQKPDTRKVSKTNDAHPETQCRMDTYLAGMVCNVDRTLPVSDSDYRQGSCVEGAAKVGFRPRCWFAP